MNVLAEVFNTPWKAVNEVCMYLLKIPAILNLKLMKVEIGRNFKFYGLPRILKFRGSKIIIGDRFENRNIWDTNPLGINHPTIICTWGKDAVIRIGHNVGISGGSIIASKNVEIGDGTIIGANSTIMDTDFHPLASFARRYSKENVKSRPVKIGKNVFIGMNCTILKGVTIPDNSIVPAGSVIRRWEI